MDDPDQQRVPESLQDVLDASWRSAVESAREGVESLRLISPELVQELPESTCREISSAMGDFERALKSLHGAGKAVIGENVYAAFLNECVRSRTGSS